MKTQIFKNYLEFLARQDNEVNGVSESFAQLHPDFEKQNETNEGCWNCYDCYDCSRCYVCSDCYGCYGCYGCQQNNLEEGGIKVPVIQDIHQKVLEAVSAPGALNMGQWHTCETTHCRAGWVVQLAGKEGKELEAKTSTHFAAMQIYRVSSKISVTPKRFYETNEVAMADIKRCAEEEKNNPHTK